MTQSVARAEVAVRAGEDRVPFHALLDNYLAVFLAAIVGFGLVATALVAARLLAPFSKENGQAARRTSAACCRSGSTRAQIQLPLLPLRHPLPHLRCRGGVPLPVGRDASYDASKAAFWEMVLFIGILGAGLGYAWKKGVLQWNK